jgi:HEAT repeat protein
VTWLDADPGAEARYRTIEALHQGPEARDRLLAALADESWRVRRLAVDRLTQLEPSLDFVSDLVGLLGQRGETGTRNAAASVLSQLGSAAVPPVLALLAHPDPDQRKFAADILCELARPEATEALVAALDDPDANVRVAAAEALGHLGGASAHAAMLRLLDSADPMLRVCALEGLAEQRSPPPLPALAPALLDRLTRASAFRVLGLVEHPSAFALICRALGSIATRDSALVALGERGRPVTPESEASVRAVLRASRDLVPWLTHALEAAAPERRLGALLAAHALAEPSTALAVARAVRPGPVAELALKVLVRLGVRGARLLLSATRALAELPSASRAVVAEALVRLAEPSLVSSLANLLRSGDAELAELAIRALGRTRAATAIAPLLAGFDDELLAPHAFRALVLLTESWPSEVREALVPLVKGAPRAWVVRSWAAIVHEEALEVVQRALKHPDQAVRAAAAEAAPAVGGQAGGNVRSALMDEAPAVRRAAARSLAHLELEEGRALLGHALADADPAVLTLAATAAAELAAEGSLPRLVELTRHAEASVVLAALSALSLLSALSDELLLHAAAQGDPEMLKQVFALGADRPAVLHLALTALAHPRWDVRVSAGRLLAVAGGEAELARLREAALAESDPVARESLERVLHALASP